MLKKVLLFFFIFSIFTNIFDQRGMVYGQINDFSKLIRVEWRSIGIGGGGWFTTVAIDTLNPGTVYVGSDVGGFYKSTDYGLSWQILNNGLTDYYVEKILPDPIHPGVIYLGTWGGIHKSTDGGYTWVPKRNGFPSPSRSHYTAPIGALALDPVNPNIIYAGIGMPRLGYKDSIRWCRVPTKGAIFKSTDAGETWQMLRGTTGIDTTALFYSLAVAPYNPNIIFAGTHLGVYRSTDAGLTWQLKNSGLPPMPESVVVRGIAIDPLQPGRVYIATAPDLDIARNSQGSGIWVTNNYGETWQACTTGAVRNNFRRIIVNPKNPAVLYAGALYGARAGVYKSTNYGQSWFRITTNNNVHRGWIYFWGYSPDGLALDYRDTSIIFYTNSHAVMKTTNAGENWWYCYTQLCPDSTWQTTGLEVTCIRQIVPDPVDSNIIYIPLYDIGLLKSINRGLSFRYLHGQMYPYGNTTFALAIHPANHQILYAGTGPWTSVYGKFWRSTDGGENWELLSGLPDSGHKSTILIDPNSREDSTIIYVWVSRFGVYKSTDGGQTWQRKDNGLNITIRSDSFIHNHPQMMAMDVNNPNILYLCLPKRRKVYKTTDGGEHWFELPLPRRLLEPWGIAVSPLNGAVFLITRASSYGGVYRSFDGGLSWDSLPTFRLDGYTRPAVRTVAFSPFDTNLVALGVISWAMYDSSTGLGVYISTNRGETWLEANDGLSNRRIYYLTFDPHNPNILYCGTSGNGVFVGEIFTSAIVNTKNKKENIFDFAVQPNIIKTKTTIKLSLLKPAKIKIGIYDALGKKVDNLIDQNISSGEYRFLWPSDGKKGFLINKGIYFVIINIDNTSFKKKIVFVR